jgi:hypothetical protein
MIPKYRYKPGAYYITIFIITYALWFSGAYLSFHDDSGLYILLMLPGMMTPFLIALFMIFTSKNSDLKKDFINRFINLLLVHMTPRPKCNIGGPYERYICNKEWDD